METVTIAYSQEWFSRSKLYGWELITGHLRRATKLFFSAMKTVCRAVPPPHWWNQGPETRSEFLSSPGQCQASSYSLFLPCHRSWKKDVAFPLFGRNTSVKERKLAGSSRCSHLLSFFLLSPWAPGEAGLQAILAFVPFTLFHESWNDPA